MAYRRRSLQLLQQLVRTGEHAQPACVTVEGVTAQNEALRLQRQLGRSITTSSARLADPKSPGATAQAPPYALVGGALAATGGLLYLLFGGQHPFSGTSFSGPQKAEAREADSSEPGLGVGASHIGEYSITNHKGEQFTPAELHGDFALLYFGTTKHPDTVSQLERLAEIVGHSDRLSNMHFLNPVFVTISPDKDGEEQMNNVVSLFDTNHNRTGVRLTGLTGPDTQKLHKSALIFGDRTQKPVDEPDTTFFFVDPHGSFIRAYSGLTDTKEIAEDMAGVIKKYKLANPMWHGPKKISKRLA